MDRRLQGLIRPFEREIVVVARVIDLGWIVAALWISFQLFGHDWQPRNTQLALFAGVLFYFCAELCEVYRPWRGEPLQYEIASVIAAWAMVGVAVLVAGYAFKISSEYSRLAVGIWFPLTLTLPVAYR